MTAVCITREPHPGSDYTDVTPYLCNVGQVTESLSVSFVICKEKNNMVGTAIFYCRNIQPSASSAQVLFPLPAVGSMGVGVGWGGCDRQASQSLTVLPFPGSWPFITSSAFLLPHELSRRGRTIACPH